MLNRQNEKFIAVAKYRVLSITEVISTSFIEIAKTFETSIRIASLFFPYNGISKNVFVCLFNFYFSNLVGL